MCPIEALGRAGGGISRVGLDIPEGGFEVTRSSLWNQNGCPVEIKRESREVLRKVRREVRFTSDTEVYMGEWRKSENVLFSLKPTRRTCDKKKKYSDSRGALRIDGREKKKSTLFPE